MSTANDLRRIWHHWKFRLSGLLLLAPVAVIVSDLMDPHDDFDARVLSSGTVGPWTVTLAEAWQGPPATNLPGTIVMKDLAARFCDGCARDIRAAYLTVDHERPSIDQAGSPLHGNPHHLEAHVFFPTTFRGDERLWLTVDAWDGSVFQTSWALAELLR